LAVFWAALFGLASANELVVEGSALIVGGDVGQARELATRRALARAAELKGANVNSSSLVRPEAVYDSIQLSASACTENAESVSEQVQDNELTVALTVTVREGHECQPSCKGVYTNRILVTGFAMEFPEQKLVSENVRLSQLTAVELSRKIKRRRHLLSDFSDTAFPYVSPARAPEPYLAPSDNETQFSSLAKNFRAQYVLSGVYRDFGLKGPLGLPVARRIEIEAFLHDGVNGEVLAQHNFVRETIGFVLLSPTPTIGSDAFYKTRLGKAWGSLLEEMAAWVETQAACLPFSARVLKVSGKQMQIDGGAESKLSPGDTLNVHHWIEPPVYGINGLTLGKEKKIQASASIRAVYPRFSVIEINDLPAGAEIKAGDILYVQ
jgi:Flagellar assembly protein T, middle domain/Flagellar assembly protein T, N-terminal domain